MAIRYLFDIGGTHIRTAFFMNGNVYDLKKEKHNFKSLNELLNKIATYIDKNRFSLKYGKASAVIAIAGIVENNVVISATNLSFLNGSMIPNTINETPITAINDADACLLGEIIYNRLDDKKNILSLIFGTGVGSGLYVNGKLVPNSEVDGLFETYMAGTVFDQRNIDKIYKYFKINIENVVEFLNIDVIVLNGFINNYKIFKKIKKEINVRPYFKNKLNIIFSNAEEPVIRGCCSKYFT